MVLEMLEDAPEMTVAIVPLGGGGLISGIALALKLQNPAIRIIGVQTETVAPYRRFLIDGSLEEVSPARTRSPTHQVKRPGAVHRQVIACHVDQIVTVDDNAIAGQSSPCSSAPAPSARGLGGRPGGADAEDPPQGRRPGGVRDFRWQRRHDPGRALDRLRPGLERAADERR